MGEAAESERGGGANFLHSISQAYSYFSCSSRPMKEESQYLLPADVIRSLQGRLAVKRGDRAEAKTARMLKKDGWSCARTKSGPVDIIAAKQGRVLLIQVKSGSAKITSEELSTFIKWAEDFNADAEVWKFGSKRTSKRKVNLGRDRIP